MLKTADLREEWTNVWDSLPGFVVLGTAYARGVLFMPDSLESFGALPYCKRLLLPQFPSITTKLYRKYGDLGRGGGYGYRVNPNRILC